MKLTIDGYDYSQRYSDVTLTGTLTSPTTTLAVGLVVSQLDSNFAVPTIPRHAPLIWATDEGTVVFQGVVVWQKQETATLTLKAMDFGYYLSNNTGWYDFNCTPEAAVAQLVADFGMTVGDLATTGVTVSYNFSGTYGVALHQIINTMYGEASPSTGQKYIIRFEGTALTVREKATTPLVRLSPGANLSTSSQTIDVSGYCNTVEIRDSVGNLVNTLGGAEDGVGMLCTTLIQRDGEDATAAAETLLEDGQGTQTVAVTCTGDIRLMVGVAVSIDQTSAGVEGLFWIDSATHTWKGAEYTCSLSLNFRNLMS